MRHKIRHWQAAALLLVPALLLAPGGARAGPPPAAAAMESRGPRMLKQAPVAGGRPAARSAATTRRVAPSAGAKDVCPPAGDAWLDPYHWPDGCYTIGESCDHHTLCCADPATDPDGQAPICICAVGYQARYPCAYDVFPSCLVCAPGFGGVPYPIDWYDPEFGTNLEDFPNNLQEMDGYECLRCAPGSYSPGGQTDDDVMMKVQAPPCTRCPAGLTGPAGAKSYDEGCSTPTGANSDPHLVGFHGQHYSFCEEEDGARCKGRVFNLVSEATHQLNTLINRHAGPDAWPHAGTWMVGYGLHYSDALALEVALATDAPYEVLPDPGRPGKTRAAPVPGGFRALLASARVNGQDALAAWVDSGRTMALAGGAAVHFPSARHAHDASSGPLAVVTTPGLRVTIFIEAGDIWHLDFKISIVSDDITHMHGLLGQSLSWRPGAPACLEGDEMEYAVEGGLLGCGFKHNRFQDPAGATEAAGAADLLGRKGRAVLGAPRSFKGAAAGSDR